MAGGVSGPVAGGAWARRGCAQLRRLRTLVRDTQRALSDVAHVINTECEVSATIQEIGNQANRVPALVILGRNPAARVRLLHALLGVSILPDDLPRGVRWIRIQYGATLQVQLSLGNSDFELLEELHCCNTSWDTLPLQDLMRKEPSDITTVLDIEMNNSFLKEGIRIVIPPDIAEPAAPADTMQTLKHKNAQLFFKREIILKNFNPIFVYAMDTIGRKIFPGEREADGGWSQQSYHTSQPPRPDRADRADCEDESVFSLENCLDLQQAKELTDNCHVLFLLFSNSRDIAENDRNCFKQHSLIDSCNIEDSVTKHADCKSKEREEKTANEVERGQAGEVSESAVLGEQIAFLSELVDRWKIISNPSPKKDVTLKWLIIEEDKLSGEPSEAADSPERSATARIVSTRQSLHNKLLRFGTESIQCHVLEFSRKLSEVHVSLTQRFVLASFELARELQVVPKKIEYAVQQEQALFHTISEKFSEGEKKSELVEIMQQVLADMKADVTHMDWSVDDLPCHQEQRSPAERAPGPVRAAYVPWPSSAGDVEPAQSYEDYNFDDYVIISSTDSSSTNNYLSPDSSETANPIYVENESDMLSVDSSIVRFGARLISGREGAPCRGSELSVKHASLDVQHTVLASLSNKIANKLVQFVDCLRDSYFGTLQRCLESLESSCREELGGRPVSEAMRQVVSVARGVDLQACASFPVLQTLIESVRRLFHRLRAVSGGTEPRTCCVLSPTWRRHVALHTVQSLSAHKLAKIISLQILERLRSAHERYQSALGSLQAVLEPRLHHTEDVKLAIRKKYAPGFARLSLESTSMCDLLQHGMPELGREIGRGQYGVVYACGGTGRWAGHEPCALKSVLPADDRHYNELAMELFYTRSIPPHPRVVPVLGSVVCGAGVLLVCARRVRDLHAAVRHGLSFHSRMSVARDIVEGIRYLHSLGLVHRDIKLQNVLLDAEGRAALADLGFCSARALLSGSLVGTPAHMAPELITGDYGAAVDVYAFGILFWYICAGNIKLPSAFEVFQSKEDLWTKVQKGLRPERLPHFPDACWDIMQSCWHAVPARRALLGEVQAQLGDILGDAHRYQHLDDTTNATGDLPDDLEDHTD